jgi:hypothetical protein
VPLVAAAVCPHPPVIVPEIAGAAAGELAALRAACDAALVRLAAAGARSLLVVGDDERDRRYSHPYRGSFAPWGLPLEVSIGASPDRPGEQPERLPLSLLVGAWLVRRAFRPAVPVTYRMETVGRRTTPGECARRGARTGSDRPWALLVMGDGSARRGETTPGYGGADAEALLGLDPVLSAELGVAGRAPWQLLAGAARGAGGRWRGDLSYYAAPYGVAYFVANWERA